MAARNDRDARVAEVLGAAIGGRPGRWLVAGDLPLVAAALPGADLWTRRGCRATPWPPDGPYDGVGVRLPVGTEAQRMVFHALGARLAPGGRLVVAGANDEGIRAAPARLAEVFAEVGAGVPRRHCRTIEAWAPRQGLRGAIGDWAEPVAAEVAGRALRWLSWPGLFAHGRLDEGTRLLLEHLPDPAGRKALDFGCGSGVVSAFLAAAGAGSVDACDVDALAVHAARANVPAARVTLADGLPDGGPWDLVATNPPLHAGKETDRAALDDLLARVPARLAPGGSVVLVTHATVRLAGPLVATRLASSDAFAVYRLTRPR